MFIAAVCKGLRTRVSPQTGSRRLSLKRYLSVFARRTDHVVVVKSAGSPGFATSCRGCSPTVTAEPCSVPPPHPGLQRPTTPCSATSARSPMARTRPTTASHTPPPAHPGPPTPWPAGETPTRARTVSCSKNLTHFHRSSTRCTPESGKPAGRTFHGVFPSPVVAPPQGAASRRSGRRAHLLTRNLATFLEALQHTLCAQHNPALLRPVPPT